MSNRGWIPQWVRIIFLPPVKWSSGHSLVSENVSILVGIEGQFEDAVHNAALDRHLGVLQLLLTSVLPNGIRGHGAIQVAQKILHCCRLVIGCRAHLERWGGGGTHTTDVARSRRNIHKALRRSSEVKQTNSLNTHFQLHSLKMINACQNIASLSKIKHF